MRSRPLSDKGRKQTKRLGDHLASIGFTADAIITSPKIRAEQTAQIIAERIKTKVSVDDRLGGPFELDTIEAILADAGDPERVVLVGHDPDFSETLAALAGPRLEMKKGALASIQVDRPLRAGSGTLRWLIPPDAIKGR